MNFMRIDSISGLPKSKIPSIPYFEGNLEESSLSCQPSLELGRAPGWFNYTKDGVQTSAGSQEIPSLISTMALSRNLENLPSYIEIFVWNFATCVVDLHPKMNNRCPDLISRLAYLINDSVLRDDSILLACASNFSSEYQTMIISDNYESFSTALIRSFFVKPDTCRASWRKSDQKLIWQEG
jgi:hypothetical protein